MARLATLAAAKRHLRIDDEDHNADVDLKLIQASDIILRYLNGRLLSVSSITGVGGVATVTTASAHGLTTNDSVTVWGAAQAEYNGTATVTVTSPTKFTYAISGTPVSPATGGVGISAAETWTDVTVPRDVQGAMLCVLEDLYEHRPIDWDSVRNQLTPLHTPALA